MDKEKKLLSTNMGCFQSSLEIYFIKFDYYLFSSKSELESYLKIHIILKIIFAFRIQNISSRYDICD